jgi:hypothetical protein
MTAIVGLLTLYLAVLHCQDGIHRMRADRAAARTDLKISASYFGIAAVEIYHSGVLTTAYVMSVGLVA